MEAVYEWMSGIWGVCMCVVCPALMSVQAYVAVGGLFSGVCCVYFLFLLCKALCVTFNLGKVLYK